MIADRTNEVFVSPISLWEIAIKSGLGRIRAEVDEVLEASVAGGLRPLPSSLDHAARVARLPEIHRDPFDRALVAQAQHEPLYLLTHDAALAAYGEHILLV